MTLKVDEVTPDSYVYMSCKKMMVKVYGKSPGSVRVCLLLKLGQKAAINLEHGLICKNSNIPFITWRSVGQINGGV